MNRLIVTGIGTDVGKTLVSAILATLLQADYWKPIQCDDDTHTMRQLLNPENHAIHPPAYSFRNPLSPHHAARLEGVTIRPDSIVLPLTPRPLVIESAGGLFVPLTSRLLTFDLFHSWRIPWVIVSRHYLGSINHTLLTCDALKRAGCSILGIIFNGEPNPDSEGAILEITQLPLIGRLYPEARINQETIHKYAQRWKKPNMHLASLFADANCKPASHP